MPNFKTRPGEVRSSLKVGTFFPPLRAVVQSIPETALRWCRSFLQLSVGASTLPRKSFRGNDIFVCVWQYVRPQRGAGGFFNSILDNSAQELLIPKNFHIVIFKKVPNIFWKLAKCVLAIWIYAFNKADQDPKRKITHSCGKLEFQGVLSPKFVKESRRGRLFSREHDFNRQVPTQNVVDHDDAVCIRFATPNPCPPARSKEFPIRDDLMLVFAYTQFLITHGYT